jgi:hypothetical protein
MSSKPIYHYTDARAFAGIVEKSTLWATDFRYLNDTQELRFAWDALVEELNKRTESSAEFAGAYAAQLKALQKVNVENLKTAEHSVFVACFSESPDDLNQWRNYANDGAGLALEFDSEQLQRSCRVGYYNHSPDGHLVPVRDQYNKPIEWMVPLEKVQYGEAARDEAITWVLDYIKKVASSGHPHSDALNLGNSIFRIPALLARFSTVKADVFSSEQEWRLTLAEHFGMSPSQMMALASVEGFEPFGRGALTTLDVKFRKGGTAVFKPYTCIPFAKSALVEVILGPKIEAGLGAATIRRILDRYGFRHTGVSTSTLSYCG